MLKLERGMDADAIAALCDGGRFAPEPLSDAERAALTSRTLDDAPAHIAGDYPEWLDGYLAQVFGEDRVAEATAMASRAPLDLRVNTLKAKREKVQGSIAHLGAKPTPWSPIGLRIELGADARNPGIHAEEDFIKGADRSAGRRLATRGAVVGGKTRRAGDRSLRRRRRQDAGAGGDDAGQGPADRDRPRQAPARADPRAAVARGRPQRRRAHAEGRQPIRSATSTASADLVLIDAPCTGTGTWRRNPDAKWRMRPGALEVRLKDQSEVLDRAAGLVKPGGRIAYITCSVLPPENGEQIRAFVAPPSGFCGGAAGADGDACCGTRPRTLPQAALQSPEGWLMTPRRTGTDGFFVSVLRKAADIRHRHSGMADAPPSRNLNSELLLRIRAP